LDSILTSTSAASESGGAVGESRVRIRYEVELFYSLAGRADFLFLIHPARTPQQTVKDEVLVLDPSVEYELDVDVATGNRLLKTQADSGTLRVHLDAIVDVRHVLVDVSRTKPTPPVLLPAEALRYLVSSRYCQTDQVQALAWREFGHLAPGYEQVRAVAEWVRERTTFKPGTSGPSTSAIETLEQGAGVCRDFAHLMIALCRALNYPARFTTAVDFGADPGLGPPDFHAYVEVFLDRWYIFDPTGISPTTGLIRIATGRDAADVSFATIFGPVQAGMPKVAFHAVEDMANGIAVPTPTKLAVSTAAL
jgi:transglutaminase-like putative cysteine protease